ncbi:DNA topoisomerase I [Cellvibrio zantedeschiae]|uniref:DNA topoisomerase n=1 Tax=Cellvibrio zantedeschiae TaxID=1237077 RepID=A0ABQ3B0Y6_9GAMM|nr:DNA topoisomerase IB [Cellvibrio zantedeschiae]GGY73940.1 DNA topoisomerase I [Cellvibrio zantedeschiae]
MLSLTEDIHIPAKKIHTILNDAEKAAKAVKLVYVQDSQPGISRKKVKNNFQYFLDNKRVVDEVTLERIKKLVIPPAWTQVWICSLDNGHLQATGLDVKKRKQYKYHALWNSLRNHTKFYRLYEFGKAIPVIRQKLQQDLALPGMPVEKVLAAVVCLMEQTSIRIGNNIYEKLYGSFGLTTLKNKHVKISGSQLQFVFKGKKGMDHNISISDRRLAKIVKQCREIPGKELFQYYDEEGNHKSIDSGMVNNYLKSIVEQDFTAKDFRTWAGTLQAIKAFKEMERGESLSHIKQNIIAMLDAVSAHLGNTRTVCKKYYIHPAIINLYEQNQLEAYFKSDVKKEKDIKPYDLTTEEKLLMKILEKEKLICQ